MKHPAALTLTDLHNHPNTHQPDALAVPQIKNPAKLSAAKARRLGCVSPQTIGFLEQLEQEERKIRKMRIETIDE